ncbi:MAG: dual specificity protein phosphatase family protein [Cyanobacteria bacterium P01_H01_bin.58]
MPEMPLSESIWWLIPDKLAGMRKPTASEIETLAAAGIGAVVSVMDDPSNLDLYKAASIPHLWLPTQGGTAPTVEQATTFRAFVNEQTAAGHAIAVHCSSGRRRTGTMLGAYLVLSGSSYEAAIAAITQANPAVEMREAQLVFLQTLANP